jgi:hypothetical protein
MKKGPPWLAGIVDRGRGYDLRTAAVPSSLCEVERVVFDEFAGEPAS